MEFLIPQWSAPANVHAMSTYRQGGVSLAPYTSLNLALHVGDEGENVAVNRRLLQEASKAPSPIYWLNQTHSPLVVPYGSEVDTADGCYSCQPRQTLAIMTADCLPILLTNVQGNWVAAVHAGWRGVARGILSAAVQAYAHDAAELIVWIGPGISQHYFEVGEEVRDIFVQQNPDYAMFFAACLAIPQKYYLDLPGLAQYQLLALGVSQVFLSGECTYAQSEDYFSYRRDGQTGRMATLIWFS